MRIRGQPEIAKAFGVTVKTIAEWQAAGFPVAVHGKAHTPNEYDLPDCIAWYKDREVEKVRGEKPQDRLARAQAIRVEMEIAKDRKILIPAAEVEPRLRAVFVAAREELLRARRRLVARLEKTATRQARDKAVAEVHDTFLRTIADWRRPDDEAQQ